MKESKDVKKFVEDWIWHGEDPAAIELCWSPAHIRAIVKIVSAYSDPPNQEVATSPDPCEDCEEYGGYHTWPTY